MSTKSYWPRPGRRYHVREARWGDDLPGASPYWPPCVTIVDLATRYEKTIAVDHSGWDNSDAWARAAWAAASYLSGRKIDDAQRERLRRLQEGYADGTHDYHGNPLPRGAFSHDRPMGGEE